MCSKNTFFEAFDKKNYQIIDKCLCKENLRVQGYSYTLTQKQISVNRGHISSLIDKTRLKMMYLQGRHAQDILRLTCAQITHAQITRAQITRAQITRAQIT